MTRPYVHPNAPRDSDSRAATLNCLARLREHYGIDKVGTEEWREAIESVTGGRPAKGCRKIKALSEHGEEWEMPLCGRTVRIVFDTGIGKFISARSMPETEGAE